MKIERSDWPREKLLVSHDKILGELSGPKLIKSL